MCIHSCTVKNVSSTCKWQDIRSGTLNFQFSYSMMQNLAMSAECCILGKSTFKMVGSGCVLHTLVWLPLPSCSTGYVASPACNTLSATFGKGSFHQNISGSLHDHLCQIYNYMINGKFLISTAGTPSRNLHPPAMQSLRKCHNYRGGLS